MLTINAYSHIPFIHTRLMKMLLQDSFSKRFRLSIGAEIDCRLREYPDGEEIEFSSVGPVEALYMWIAENGGLDPEWLAMDDGSYWDDEGKLFPSTSQPYLSGVEQLATYGLWLIDVEMKICGASSEEDFDENSINPHGWTQYEVVHHKAECLLLAYQALSYAERMLSNEQPSSEEKAKAAQFNFAKLGKDGAIKRHARMNELREWAVSEYRNGEWKSANQAAHFLKDKIVQHGRTIGAHLTDQNAQRTIADWFRKSA